MRKEFELTETEVLSIERITRGLKPGDEPKPGTVDRINAAWAELGKAHGFDWETVEQIDGKPYHQFTAEESAPEGDAQPPAPAEPPPADPDPENHCISCFSKIEDGRGAAGQPEICLTYPEGIPASIADGDTCEYHVDRPAPAPPPAGPESIDPKPEEAPADLNADAPPQIQGAPPYTDDTATPNPDGYLRAGRAVLGRYFQPSYSPEITPPPSRQPSLFGPEDEIRTAIEKEIKELQTEAAQCRKTINRAEERLDDLDSRIEALQHAAKILEKIRPADNPDDAEKGRPLTIADIGPQYDAAGNRVFKAQEKPAEATWIEAQITEDGAEKAIYPDLEAQPEEPEIEPTAETPEEAEKAAQVRKIKARAPRKPHSGHLKARKEKPEEGAGIQPGNQSSEGLKETVAKLHGCNPRPPKK